MTTNNARCRAVLNLALILEDQIGMEHDTVHAYCYTPEHPDPKAWSLHLAGKIIDTALDLLHCNNSVTMIDQMLTDLQDQHGTPAWNRETAEIRRNAPKAGPLEDLFLLKYQEALVAWTPGTDLIRVGPLIDRERGDWTRHPIRYSSTGGAAYIGLRECKDKLRRDLMLFIEFHSIVIRDKVSIEAAHKAFLAIDEYRQRISPDIQGADPSDSMGGWL